MTQFRKWVFLGSTLFFVIVATTFASLGKIKGETLALIEVEKRFGSENFEESAFRTGQIEKRASMAASLIKNKKKYIGLESWRIRDLLGTYSGHYFSEKYATFFIYRGKNRSDDSWQLLFIIDKQSKVADIVVHKNCCY